jgi:hypothetical protein
MSPDGQKLAGMVSGPADRSVARAPFQDETTVVRKCPADRAKTPI